MSRFQRPAFRTQHPYAQSLTSDSAFALRSQCPVYVSFDVPFDVPFMSEFIVRRPSRNPNFSKNA
jgi:hypothetical protein